MRTTRQWLNYFFTRGGIIFMQVLAALPFGDGACHGQGTGLVFVPGCFVTPACG